MWDGELGTCTNCTSHVTSLNSFKKYKARELGAWNACLEHLIYARPKKKKINMHKFRWCKKGRTTRYKMVVIEEDVLTGGE
jgi:hypothetical protein